MQSGSAIRGYKSCSNTGHAQDVGLHAVRVACHAAECPAWHVGKAINQDGCCAALQLAWFLNYVCQATVTDSNTSQTYSCKVQLQKLFPLCSCLFGKQLLPEEQASLQMQTLSCSLSMNTSPYQET